MIIGFVLFFYLCKLDKTILIMSNQNTNPDTLSNAEFDKPAIPQGLNVLTILTFIGCSIFFLLSLATPWILKFSKNLMDKATSSGQELTPEQLEKIQLGRANIELSEINMIPLMVIGIAGILLCFVGALMMRKLKKDGYWIYVAGQILPLVSTAFIMGVAQYKEIGSLVMLAFPVIFIILYTVNRKHLVN